MQISTAIKVVMAEKNISAVALARASGLGRSSIQRTINNLYNPRLDNLQAISKGLGLKLSELIELAEKYGESNGSE